DGIYLHDAESGEAKRILKPESDDALYRPGSWLPDGSALLVWRNDPGHDQLVNLPFTGGEADASRLRPLLPSASHQTDPRLSRDGRHLAFGSDESGKRLTYVVEFHPDGSTGRPVEVRTAGSSGHQWAADGRTLYVEDERRRLMKVT